MPCSDDAGDSRCHVVMTSSRGEVHRSGDVLERDEAILMTTLSRGFHTSHLRFTCLYLVWSQPRFFTNSSNVFRRINKQRELMNELMTPDWRHIYITRDIYILQNTTPWCDLRGWLGVNNQLYVYNIANRNRPRQYQLASKWRICFWL